MRNIWKILIVGVPALALVIGFTFLIQKVPDLSADAKMLIPFIFGLVVGCPAGVIIGSWVE